MPWKTILGGHAAGFAGVVAIAAALAVVAPAAAGSLAGSWSGVATINGDSTALEIDVAPCGADMCASFGLPQLGLEHVPVHATQFGVSTGVLEANPVSARLVGDVLNGTLSGIGAGVFVDAIPRGKRAVFALRRVAPTPDPVPAEEIAFRDGDVKLAGTFVKPPGRGPFPAVVFVHGSGPSTRWYAFGQAEALVRLGFAALVYDKRGSGQSEGDWTQASLDDLARDAVAAVGYVASRPDVDHNRVGLWGHSQGGWVVPRALRLGAQAAFAIVVAGGGIPPRQVETSNYAHTLDALGIRDDARARALSLVDIYFNYLSGRTGHAQIQAAFNAAKKESWFEPLGLAHVLPDENDRAAWSWVADYDPSGDIAALRLPLLLLFAGADDETPTLSSLAAWNAALSAEESVQTEIVYFPKATHAIRTGTSGWLRRPPSFQDVLQGWLSLRR